MRKIIFRGGLLKNGKSKNVLELEVGKRWLDYILQKISANKDYPFNYRKHISFHYNIAKDR